MKSRTNFSMDTETVYGDIQDAISSLRRLGVKTAAAIYEIALIIGATERRVRTLFFRDGEVRITDEERRTIRDAVIEYHRHLAAKHRELAVIEEGIANTKEIEKHLNQLSMEAPDEPSSSRKTTSIRPAA